MSIRTAPRGQPLLFLGAVLLGWISLRVVLWESPFVVPERLADVVSPLADWQGDQISDAQTERPEAPASHGVENGTAAGSVRDGRPAEVREPLLPPLLPPLPEPLPTPSWLFDAPASPGAFPKEVAQADIRSKARVAIGQNLLLAAGLSQVELPESVARLFRPAAATQAPRLAGAAPNPAGVLAPQPESPASRWTGDVWLLARSAGGPLQAAAPSYGRSQAGAVIRYRLSPQSGLRPQAQLRASSALQGMREREVAIGLSAQPIEGAPVRLVAELRATETESGTEARPAAYAVTQLPPLRLPLGAQAEVYLQAGYVGGESATALVDGQARIGRPVARIGDAEFAAAAAAWGGAQEGAARLDIGPSASVTFRLGETRGRVAADYRFRIAGDAEPDSGPAVTLSAGF